MQMTRSLLQFASSQVTTQPRKEQTFAYCVVCSPLIPPAYTEPYIQNIDVMPLLQRPRHKRGHGEGAAAVLFHPPRGHNNLFERGMFSEPAPCSLTSPT